MPKIALAAALIALAAAPFPALAAPASVSVQIAPELQEKAAKTYGDDELARVAGMLQQTVERALARSGAYDDARVELTLADAVPNRPTFKQLAERPELSMASFSVGGAQIEGRIVTADGQAAPLSYRWYESDIRHVHSHWTWADANSAFNRFAHRLSRGEALASR